MGKSELEKKMQTFLNSIQEQRDLGWESHFNEILDAFEDFLINRPEPPEEWKARLGANAKKFDPNGFICGWSNYSKHALK